MVQIRTLLRGKDSAINTNTGTTAISQDCLHREARLWALYPKVTWLSPVIQPLHSHHLSSTISPLATLTSDSGKGQAWATLLTLSMFHHSDFFTWLTPTYPLFGSQRRCSMDWEASSDPRDKAGSLLQAPHHAEHPSSHLQSLGGDSAGFVGSISLSPCPGLAGGGAGFFQSHSGTPLRCPP